METPLISVVTINFNGKHFAERCIRSVIKEGKKPFEIVFVDNGSTDGSVDFIKKKFNQTNKLRLIELKENIGPAEARNIGVRKSRGKYILILDNDTKIKAGWYKKIIDFFEKNKQSLSTNKHRKIGLVQPKLLIMGTNKFNYAGDLISPFGFLVERSRSEEDKGQFDKTEPIFSLNIASAFFKKEIFKKIGEFDKDYYFYWEEADLAWRSWLYGYQNLFYPDITVWHAYGTKEKEKQYKKEGNRQNQALYFGCKNMITTLIKNLETRNLILILPLNIISWLIFAFSFLLKGNLLKALLVIKAITWNIVNLKEIVLKRKKIQSARKISDSVIFSSVGTKPSISYYLGKAFAYVKNKPF